MKILIVDDSTFMRTALKNMIIKSGWGDVQIVEAADGNEALVKFNEERPDLMLLDVIMPQKDGIEVLKEIGKIATVIVISAVGQEKIIEQAKWLGAKDYIVKPFDPRDVIETIAKIMGKAPANENSEIPHQTGS